MESFTFPGSSDTPNFGTVTNPSVPEYIAGGSSSGSDAAPVTSEIDIAIGGNQGGSIRIPASCCGIVGLKPTTGLIRTLVSSQLTTRSIIRDRWLSLSRMSP